MTKVDCVFCGTRGERAKEHVWPVWIQKVVEHGSALRVEIHLTISGDKKNQRVLQNQALVLGSVCKSCNGGWMSKLEQDVAPTIKRLLAEPSPLGGYVKAAEATALATWAMKTAIVRNLGANYRKIVPKQHYMDIFEGGLPDYVYVDLAIDPRHRTLGAVQSQTAAGLLGVGDEEAFRAAGERLYNIVLGVGSLLFRVVYFPLRDYEIRTALAHGRNALRLHPNPKDGQLSPACVVDGLHDLETATFFQRSEARSPLVSSAVNASFG